MNRILDFGEMYLERLLEHQDFDMLTKAQQSQVLEYLNKEEYDGMRQAHLMAKASFFAKDDHLHPDPTILQKLKREVSNRKKIKGISFKLIERFNDRIPAYQAVAAAILLAFGLHYLGNSLDTSGENMGNTIMFADTTTATQTKITQDEDTVREDTMIGIN